MHRLTACSLLSFRLISGLDNTACHVGACFRGSAWVTRPTATAVSAIGSVLTEFMRTIVWICADAALQRMHTDHGEIVNTRRLAKRPPELENGVAMGDRRGLLDQEPLRPGGKPESGACTATQGGNLRRGAGGGGRVQHGVPDSGDGAVPRCRTGQHQAGHAVPVANWENVHDHSYSRRRCLAERFSR